MLINKELKTAIVRPNQEYMSRLALYFAHRTQALKNLSSTIKINKCGVSDNGETTSFSDTSSSCSKKFENVKCMISVIESSLLLPHPKPECSTLRNSFSGKVATPEQRSDLIGFRGIGQRDFKQYIMTNTLHLSSAKSTHATKHNLHLRSLN